MAPIKRLLQELKRNKRERELDTEIMRPTKGFFGRFETPRREKEETRNNATPMTKTSCVCLPSHSARNEAAAKSRSAKFPLEALSSSLVSLGFRFAD